jgi:hypothetical protein
LRERQEQEPVTATSDAKKDREHAVERDHRVQRRDEGLEL